MNPECSRANLYNLVVYLIFRFLTGFSGGAYVVCVLTTHSDKHIAAFLSVAGGTIADMFANDKVARYLFRFTRYATTLAYATN